MTPPPPAPGLLEEIGFREGEQNHGGSHHFYHPETCPLALLYPERGRCDSLGLSWPMACCRGPQSWESGPAVQLPAPLASAPTGTALWGGRGEPVPRPSRTEGSFLIDFVSSLVIG